MKLFLFTLDHKEKMAIEKAFCTQRMKSYEILSWQKQGVLMGGGNRGKIYPKWEDGHKPTRVPETTKRRSARRHYGMASVWCGCGCVRPVVARVHARAFVQLDHCYISFVSWKPQQSQS